MAIIQRFATENYVVEKTAEIEIPVATDYTIGGVMPVAKDNSMTQSVGVDENGRLWTTTGSGSGEGGTDGYTPVRGVDYWTEEDQAQIVSDVLAAIPNASGVSF